MPPNLNESSDRPATSQSVPAPLPQVSQLSGTAVTATSVPANGFVLVGDNIDKNIRTSFQRKDYQTESLATLFSFICCFILCGCVTLSDSLPSADVSSESVRIDVLQLYREFGIFVSRYSCFKVLIVIVRMEVDVTFIESPG